MFQNKSFLDILMMGGLTMYVLIGCSIVSLAVIMERYVQYRIKSKFSRRDLMSMMRDLLGMWKLPEALRVCADIHTPLSHVAQAGIAQNAEDERTIERAMERQISIEIASLEEHVAILGTIGNIAVYIGLFGTVLGIIRAFHNISVASGGGMSVVVGGVAEALICTATGLSVAIPAVVAYNYFSRRIDVFAAEMETCASEMIDLLTKKREVQP